MRLIRLLEVLAYAETRESKEKILLPGSGQRSVENHRGPILRELDFSEVFTFTQRRSRLQSGLHGFLA